MSEEKQKPCQCETPTFQQSVHAGYSGRVTCSTCKGLVDFPRPVSKYQGTDEIEKYLFDLNANSKAMSFEKAVIKMLLRIEAALKHKEAIPANKPLEGAAAAKGK